MLNAVSTRVAVWAPGTAIALTIGFAATFLSEHYGAPSMLFALLLGLALNFLYEDPRSLPGIDFSARALLQMGVALLGFRISLQDVQSIEPERLALLAGGVASTIVVGIVFARLSGLGTPMGVLTGGAVGICGASAAMSIAAVLPADKENERNTALAIVGVTSLSSLAMVFYPIMSGLLELSDHDAGFFIGATIHDVAQVVGAGYSVSSTAGDVATMTKLMRVAMLVPSVLVISLIARSSKTGQHGPLSALPGFLILFILIVIVNSTIPLPAALLSGMGELSRLCLITAIAAIGLRSNLRRLTEVGSGPLLLMLGETLWVAAFILLSISLLH